LVRGRDGEQDTVDLAWTHVLVGWAEALDQLTGSVALAATIGSIYHERIRERGMTNERTPRSTPWTCVLELDATRTPIDGSAEALVDAIRQGSDLRIGTEFFHNEHIDVGSARAERVREVAEFGVTYQVQDRWAGAIMSLRQPVALPDSFGPRSSMSFFLYNQDGRQAIARPYLDGLPADGVRGPSSCVSPADMPKYHTHDSWDEETNAPSSNFTYDFEVYRYLVRNDWEEVLSHDADGGVRSGSVEELVTAFSEGCAIKVGISDLCADLAHKADLGLAQADLADPGAAMEHELFVEIGSSYCYLEQGLFIAGSHPVVRVKPDTPLSYRSRGWDFGWLLLRTDGAVVYRRCDPYTLAFNDMEKKCSIRWFVR
jgi:hypothetical protein